MQRLSGDESKVGDSELVDRWSNRSYSEQSAYMFHISFLHIGVMETCKEDLSMPLSIKTKDISST